MHWWQYQAWPKLQACMPPLRPAGAGAELEAGDVDYLCTTPQDLLNTVENILMLYDTSRAKGTMAGEAASLMNPEAGFQCLAWSPGPVNNVLLRAVEESDPAWAAASQG